MHPGSSSHDDEFPLLHCNGLYAANISGDGDCLFHALSDQLYGNENSHTEIRAKVVQHMRHHEDYFKLFLDAGPSASRSKSKKKGSSGPGGGSISAPTPVAIDAAFQAHVTRMSKSGVYGDNMEICAFAREYDCDVKIYQRDFAYVVTGGMDGAGGVQHRSRKLLHIAYHTWEHYSSIRNIAGPHTGLPNVSPKPTTEEGRKEQAKKLASTAYALPWMIKTVMASLPYLAPEETIAAVLEECRGDVNEAVGRLLDMEYDEEGGVVEGDEAGGGVGEEVKAMKGESDLAGGDKGEKEDEGVDEGKDASPTPTPTPAQSTEKAKLDTQAEPTPKQDPPLPDTSTPKKVKGGGNPNTKKGPKADKGTNPATTTTTTITTTTTTTTTGNKTTTTPNPTHKPKPKRETARERKERQKTAAKERKKDSGGGGGDAKGKKGAKSITEGGSTGVAVGIKELYI